MQIKWRFEFPPEGQAEREIVLAAMSRAMDERTVEAIREAGAMAWAWVARHPEDYAVWDTGEPIAILAEALGIHGSAPQTLSSPRVLAGTSTR